MNEIPTYSTDRPQAWFSALARLWLLRPVRSAPSGSPNRAMLVMGAAWLILWVSIDRWQSEPDPQFLASGVPLLAWYVLAILALAALMQWRTRAPAFAPMLAVSLGAVPLPLLFVGVIAIYLDPRWFWGTSIAVGVYTLLYLARGLHAVTGESQRVAACAGLVFLSGFCWHTDALDAIPDVWTPLETQVAVPDGALADSEAILFGQAGRIDELLEAVRREASPKPQAFFL